MTSRAADTDRVRWSARAGTIAPIWFWTSLATLAVLHGSVDVSGHQLLRYGLLMYVGFFAYGSLTLVFVRGLRRRIPRRRRSHAAIAALSLFGCGPLLATFTMGSGQGVSQTWHGWLHFTGFLITSLLPIIAFPLFGSAVWSDPRWRGVGPVSLVGGVLVAVVVFLPTAPGDGYPIWSGPGSIADIVLIGAWQIVVARRLARLARPSADAGQTAGARTADNALR